MRGWALAWRTCCGDDEADEFSFGLGGVMLGSSEWAGGLRDSPKPVMPEQAQAVETALNETIASVRQFIFPFHGMPVPETESGMGRR